MWFSGFFALGVVVHIVRLIAGFSVVIAGREIPLAASGIAVLVFGILSAGLLILRLKRPCENFLKTANSTRIFSKKLLENLGRRSMKIEYLKTLWMLRFEKIKKSEEEAAWKYQEILDQCLTDLGEEGGIAPLLGRLVREERMHERMAEELIRIVHQSHTECGVLLH